VHAPRAPQNMPGHDLSWTCAWSCWRRHGVATLCWRATTTARRVVQSPRALAARAPKHNCSWQQAMRMAAACDKRLSVTAENPNERLQPKCWLEESINQGCMCSNLDRTSMEQTTHRTWTQQTTMRAYICCMHAHPNLMASQDARQCINGG
jgi:hypothetical protein